jgi:hypothetical protein
MEWTRCSNKKADHQTGIKERSSHMPAKGMTQFKGTNRLKENLENIYPANSNQKRTGVVITDIQKIGLKIRITSDKEGHFIVATSIY